MRFGFEVGLDQLGLWTKMGIGDRRSVTKENYRIDSLKIEKKAYPFELILIRKSKKLSFNVLDRSKIIPDDWVKSKVPFKWMESIQSVLTEKDSKKESYVLCLWATERKDKGFARIFAQKTNEKILSTEFILWGFQDIQLKWSLTLPAEQVVKFQCSNKPTKPIVYGENLLFLKKFSINFTNKTKECIFNFFKGKNDVTFKPHNKLRSNGKFFGKMENHRNWQSVEYTYSVILQNKTDECMKIYGPLLEPLRIEKQTSRSFFILPKDDWISALSALTCTKHIMDWDYEISQRFSKGIRQSYTPILFSEALSEDIFNFVLTEYRIKHIFYTIESQNDLIESSTEKVKKCLLEIQGDESERLSSLNLQIMSKLYDLGAIKNQIFDCIIILPNDPILALLSIPFIRYMNAIPIIYSKDVDNQINKLSFFLKTRLALSVGLSDNQVQNLPKNIELIHNIVNHSKIETIINIQTFWQKIKFLDYILEELLKNPLIHENSYIIQKFFPDSPFPNIVRQIMKLKLKKVLNPIEEAKFLKSYYHTVLSTNLKSFDTWLMTLLKLKIRNLRNQGIKDLRLNPLTLELANLHTSLISIDLRPANLINAVMYAVAKSAFIIPIQTIDRLKKNKIKGYYKDIKNLISDFKAFPMIEDSLIYRKLLETNSQINKILNNICKTISYDIISNEAFDLIQTKVNIKDHKLKMMKYLSIFSKEPSILIEKIGRNIKYSFDKEFIVGRMLCPTSIDTNHLILRSIVSEYLPRPFPKVNLVNSLIDVDNFNRLNIINKTVKSILEQTREVIVHIQSSFLNYQTDFLNVTRDSSYLFYWGHTEANSEKEEIYLRDNKGSVHPIGINLIKSGYNPYGEFCGLITCLGGKLQSQKQDNLATAFLSAGYKSVIAPFEEVPVTGILIIYLNLLINLVSEISFSELLRNEKKKGTIFSELFLFYGDPTITFPRFYPFQKESILKDIISSIKSNYPEITKLLM